MCVVIGSVPTMAQLSPLAPKSALKPIPSADPQGTIALHPPSDNGAPPEIWEIGANGTRQVRNVSVPTLTPVLPDSAKATGAAVVVAPGGAFVELSIDNEGYKIAHWLADHGIAAFVLKYRLEQTPPDPNAAKQAMITKITRMLSKGGTALRATPQALEDAEVAVRLVRAST